MFRTSSILFHSICKRNNKSYVLSILTVDSANVGTLFQMRWQVISWKPSSEINYSLATKRLKPRIHFISESEFYLSFAFFTPNLALNKFYISPKIKHGEVLSRKGIRNYWEFFTSFWRLLLFLCWIIYSLMWFQGLREFVLVSVLNYYEQE